MLLETESTCMEIEKLSGYFPLFGFTDASLRIGPMPKRTAAFAAHCVDDLLNPCRREAFMHFLDKVFLDRICIKMQHRHKCTLSAAFLSAFKQTGNIRFVITGDHRSNPDTGQDTFIREHFHCTKTRIRNRRVRLERIRPLFRQKWKRKKDRCLYLLF